MATTLAKVSQDLPKKFGSKSTVLPPVRQPSPRPVLPGQDPERVNSLYNQLVEDFGPPSLIEKIWLNDLAHLTARVEHLRNTSRGFMLSEINGVMNKDHLLKAYFNAWEISTLQSLDLNDLASETDPVISNLYNRLIGLASGPVLDKIKQFNEMDLAMLRERDRILVQFEKRRRVLLEELLKNDYDPKEFKIKGVKGSLR